MANTKTTSQNSPSALVEVLSHTGSDKGVVYNAIDEIRDMSSSNVIAAIDTLEASITGKLDAMSAEFNGKFNAMSTEFDGKLNTKVAELNGRFDKLVHECYLIRWFLGFFIVFAVAVGFFKS